jgi:hypothetical protein
MPSMQVQFTVEGSTASALKLSMPQREFTLKRLEAEK